MNNSDLVFQSLLTKNPPTEWIDWSIKFDLLPSIDKLFTAFFIIMGIWVIAKYFWMVVYEVRYGLGDEYIRGELSKQDKIDLDNRYPLFWKAFYNEHIKRRLKK
jgi:hypothetical protein